MKFGKSIGEQQEGHSTLHYVDYKLLKRRIKEVSSHLTDRQLGEALTANTGFEEGLAMEIQKVNGCFARRQVVLLEGTAVLAEELQQHRAAGREASTSSCAPASESAEGAAAGAVHWPAAFQRLVGLLNGVDELRKYAVWNAVAIVKILKKRRKQTNFGLEDSAAERAGWLSRQTFFNGSDFAELHTAIESLGHALVLSEFAPRRDGSKRPVPNAEGRQEQCAICLNTISDMVELGCHHRFCWKCFVLGPIAFQPGEYQITQCPICRRETSPLELEPPDRCTEGIADVDVFSQGILTRFLHTYFPPEDSKDAEELQDVVGDLVKVVLADANWQQGTKASAVPAHGQEGSEAANAGPASAAPRDFFETLPQRPAQERQQMYAAQKLQWLQLASNDDPLALDSTMCCSLCSEPLLMEAVVTTPCKHYFHRVCVGRLEMPSCPLCASPLPFSWFLPNEHPFADRGFRVVPIRDYRPRFPGGPSARSCGYPLHRPPPGKLFGPGRMVMTSYLHRAVPMGGTGEDTAANTPRSSGSALSPLHMNMSRRCDRVAGAPGAPEGSDASSSTGSSAESDSEDGSQAAADEHSDEGNCPVATSHQDLLQPRPKAHAWVHSAVGRMRLFRQPEAPGARAVRAGGPAGRGPGA